jgi:hypothetical protein
MSFFLDLGSDFCHNIVTSLAGAPSGGILTKRSEGRSPRPAGMPDPGAPGLHLEVNTDLPPGAG